MHKSLLSKERKISVTGLGYVGLPVALEFGKVFDVIGCDLSERKIQSLKSCEDPSNELPPESFENSGVYFTSDPADLQNAHFHIIAVPTPIDDSKNPDLSALIKATEQIANVLKPGDFVVFESTVYPGCTEEICLPILENSSGLMLNRDFYLGYSPERINPGDAQHSLSKVVKVVAGSSSFALREIASVYGEIVEAGIHQAPSIQVAEAAKVIENTQRDLNIALANELAIIFDKLNLDTLAILEAAATKWNFIPYTPGLVGGHCIGIDPFYLTYKAKSAGYTPKLILQGRGINDAMPEYIADKIATHFKNSGIKTAGRKVLQYGITFKENVSDTRNSKAAELTICLLKKGFHVDIFDPMADMAEVYNEYNIPPGENHSGKFDVIILAVAHDEFKRIPAESYVWHLNREGILIDVKGILKDAKTSDMNYWRL